MALIDFSLSDVGTLFTGIREAHALAIQEYARIKGIGV